MNHQIVIMDFTGAYEQEQFYRHAQFDWIDCKDIPGTKYLCDAPAKAKLSRKIAPYSPSGIHFIDSGNYHYMSKLWTDKIQEPFVLIVFDHHPDMQPTLFDNLLSCGCWVKEVLDENPMIQKVVLVGAADPLLSRVDTQYSGRMVAYSESAIDHNPLWKTFSSLHIQYPVYLSIDKDVLTSEEAVTDWDNGSMTLKQLTAVLGAIMQHNRIIGIDICGECSDTLRRITHPQIIDINDHCNRILLGESLGQ